MLTEQKTCSRNRRYDECSSYYRGINEQYQPLFYKLLEAQFYGIKLFSQNFYRLGYFYDAFDCFVTVSTRLNLATRKRNLPNCDICSACLL